MPNKTIYLRDADLPLFEQAQEQLGDSVSSLFAEFLRERVAKLTPEEHGIVELMNQIAEKHEAVKNDPNLPEFLQSEYAEAEAYAGKALTSLRAGEIKNAKVLCYAANTYHQWAERDLKKTRELSAKMAEMLGPGNE